MSNIKAKAHIQEFRLLLRKEKVKFEVQWNAVMAPSGTLSDYNIKKVLGIGSFGTVCLAIHVKSREKFAIKCIEKNKLVRFKLAHTLVQEVRLLRAVNFTFLTKFITYFQNNVYIFVVSSLETGGDLFQHLKKFKKLLESTARLYAAQIMLALEYLHYMGVVYRDLKPENVMLDSNGYAKLIDFGCSKRISETRTYTLCGTPEYLAPEVILGYGYHFSVDWWSYGVFLYELVAGYTPFKSESQIETYEKITKAIFSIPSNFSTPLSDLIKKLLQVDRSQRIGNMKNGSDDIKMDAWFKQVDFNQILQRKVRPIDLIDVTLCSKQLNPSCKFILKEASPPEVYEEFDELFPTDASIL